MMKSEAVRAEAFGVFGLIQMRYGPAMGLFSALALLDELDGHVLHHERGSEYGGRR